MHVAIYACACSCSVGVCIHTYACVYMWFKTKEIGHIYAYIIIQMVPGIASHVQYHAVFWGKTSQLIAKLEVAA